MSKKNLSIALLGPKNTFSDKARKELGFLDEQVVYTHSIPGIFDFLIENPDALGLVPLENLLNGQVSATFDSLLKNIGKSSPNNSVDVPKSPFKIIHTINSRIDLKIARPKNSSYSLKEAEEIYSHEQALAQSEQFLIKNCPEAKLKPVESTALAIEATKSSAKKAYAIASTDALVSEEFVDLQETVEAGKLNQTRFALISHANHNPSLLKNLKLSGSEHKVTSICLNPKMDRQGILLEILSIISEKHACNLLSIHSRPDFVGGFVFYLELEGGLEEQRIQTCLADLETYCREITGNAASVHLLGSYFQAPFNREYIQSVAIVGAKGEMGRWFSSFFSDLGMEIVEVDLDSSNSEKEKIANSDIVIFSVPFTNIDSIFREYKQFIKENTLIVDNSSLKKEACEALDRVFSENYEVVSIHTMFGPKEKSLNGHNIIFTTSKNSKSKAKELEKLFYKYGAIITHAGVDEHDKAVAITQSLVHFISLGFEKVLGAKSMNKKLLNAFLTPNSERLFENLARTQNQSEELTRGIVFGNHYSKEIRELFIQSLKTLNS